MATRSKWSPERAALAAQKYRGGATIHEIADGLGIHFTTVFRRLVADGVAIREQSPPVCPKLTAQQVVEIYSLKGGPESYASVARRYGVSKGAIGAIWSGKTWGHVTRPEEVK